MTTFGWKRKIGDKVSKTLVSKFDSEAKDESAIDRDVDWLANAKKRHINMLEDTATKSQRRYMEGIILADSERFWEAIMKWNEAIQLTPSNEKLYEMKAQALMNLNEAFPAVQSAEKAVQLNPLWWEAHQTLGRARLGIGEVKMAIKSFSEAIHINPSCEELWKDDLLWSVDILKKKTTVKISEETLKRTEETPKCTEETPKCTEETPKCTEEQESSEDDLDDNDDSSEASNERKRKLEEEQELMKKLIRIRN